MFFETYFNLWGLEGEQKVCCPFPHTSQDGNTHSDFHPSLQINLDKRLYYCPVCGAKGNEAQMVQNIFNCTSARAVKFLTTMKNIGVKHSDMLSAQPPEWDDEKVEACHNLGMSVKVLKELGASVDKVDDHFEWQFPVSWNDWVCDIRTYRPGMTPKVLSVGGAQTGMVIPYDLWKDTNPKQWTLLCAGEKDMVVARSHGFNAITLTGGEVSTPLAPAWFTGRKVAIVYDNDHAGRNGAKRVAETIAPFALEVKIVNKFHDDFGAEDTKEDITDWFVKYRGTADELKQMIRDTPTFEYKESVELEMEEAPLVMLREAIRPENIGKQFRSDIQLITTSDSKYDIPCHCEVKKVTGNTKNIPQGTVKYFDYDINDESRSKDLVFQLGGHNREVQSKIIRRAVEMDEGGVVVSFKRYNIMYACRVADSEGTEADMFFLGDDPGRHSKLNVTYFRLDDPTTGEVALLATAWSEPVNDIDNFEITDEVKSSLLFIQHHEGTVADRVNHRANAVRGLLGYEANLNLIKSIDLCYNSVKEFNYGNQKAVKGFIDCLVIGESRVGKSDTAKRLQTAYDLGAFVSLAGSAATIPGIVGGTVKDALGRNATKAGVIPRNHGGIICFEELAKCEPGLIKSLTDVRSSGLARITRVSGSVEIPAALRMCTLSNVRPVGNGETRPISSYSSGVEIVKDLVGTAEDIARYDYVYIQGDEETESDPLYMAPEPYPAEHLRNAIRWAWSRKTTDIIWEQGVEVYLSEKAKELNHNYPLHIKLFGTECWKKLCRLSCAVAAYICNTDETYEHLMVSRECVDFAADYLVSIYDNTTFKLATIVAQTKAQENIVDSHTAMLQKDYIKWHDALDYLFAHGRVDSSTFKDLTNLQNQNEFSNAVRHLVTLDFITKDGSMIYSTPKFRKTYTILDKRVSVEVL